MEVEGAAPLPKFHDQITPTTVPVLVKSTFAPVHFGAVEVKLATGVALIKIVPVTVLAHPPLLTVSVIVFVPEVE